MSYDQGNPHLIHYNPNYESLEPRPLYYNYQQPQYNGCTQPTVVMSLVTATLKLLQWVVPQILPARSKIGNRRPQQSTDVHRYFDEGDRGPGPTDDGYRYREYQNLQSPRPPGPNNRQTEDKYETKPFDYRLDDRYFRPRPNEIQQYHQQYDNRHEQYDDGYYRSRSEEPRYREDDHYQSRQQPHHHDQYHQTRHPQEPHYKVKHNVVQPAGRANNYSVKLTDLLTSVKEPEHKDTSLRRMMEVNKGYLVMMRFRPQDLGDVVTAVQESLSTLAAHHGYAIGFSEPRDMRILIPSHQMMVNDQWWDSRDNRLSRFAVCCFWFKDVFQAKRWFESSPRLKQPDFPNSHPYQVVAAPLTYGRNKEPVPFGPERDSVTLLWSEYPNIYERYHNDFLTNYSEPARRRMKDFGANPNVSVCKYKAGWPEDLNKYGQPGYARFETTHERVARAIRTGWVQPETFLNISTFPSMDAVVSFYRDAEYQAIRNTLDRYSNPVFVALTLRRVKGTSR